MIPGVGTSFEMQYYRYTDTLVENRLPYFYKLQTVDRDGRVSWAQPVCAIPNEHGRVLTVETESDREIYTVDRPVKMVIGSSNSGDRIDGTIQVALLLDGVYVGDLVSPTDITCEKGMNVSGEMLNYEWLGIEPIGAYQFVTIVSDRASSEIVALALTEFRFIGQR